MRELLDYPYIRQEQKKHFLLFDMAPLLASLAAGILLAQMGIQWSDLAVLTVMWSVCGIGIEVGYHRYFSHRSFRARPWVEALLIIWGSFSAQGPVIAWASNHRHHHRYSDREKDTHSPKPFEKAPWMERARNILHSHLLWKYRYPYPNPNLYARELLGNPVIRRWTARYRWIVISGLLLPAILGGLLAWSFEGALRSFLLGGVIRLTLGQHATWLINSACHLLGRKAYETRDNSRNIAVLALPTLGGSWHNNHHTFPHLATNSHRWWEIDPGFWFIRTLEALGQVDQVKVSISPDAVRRRTL